MEWKNRSVVDRVELYPAVISTVDCEVVEALKAWQIPLLRWPGGNVSDYHGGGIGAPDLRPTRFNSAWGGLGIMQLAQMNLCSFVN